MPPPSQSHPPSGTTPPPPPAWITGITAGASEVVCLLREDGRPWFVGPSIEAVLGYPAADALTRAQPTWVHPGDWPRAVQAFDDVRRAPGTKRSLLLRIVNRSGSYVKLEATAVNALDEPALRSIVLHAREVTGQAGYDRLTGLLDRGAFIDTVVRAFARAKEDAHYGFSILALDIDRFKLLAGSLGQGGADALLSGVADRLMEWARPQDSLARVRDGGFGVLLSGIHDAARAQGFADRLQQIFDTPFQVDRKDVPVSVSVGIATSSRTYERADDVIRDAEVAATRAKGAGHGKRRRAVFDTAMRVEGVQFLGIQSDLVTALRQEHLRVHYQPIVSVKTRRIIGFEALMRWLHPERGMVSPAEFIPVAEDTGLIVPMGNWILRAACKQAALWQAKHQWDPALYISVNISPKQFMDDDLVPNVELALKEAGLPAEQLKLEVTESVGLENRELAARTFARLKELGVRLSLDDFGTGYSSFSHLHQFAYDTLKVDRSFVRLLDGQGVEKNTEIVHAIIFLAHNLRMSVVAEGVETEAQLEELGAMWCEAAQGFYFAKPLEEKAADELLTMNRTW